MVLTKEVYKHFYNILGTTSLYERSLSALIFVRPDGGRDGPMSVHRWLRGDSAVLATELPVQLLHTATHRFLHRLARLIGSRQITLKWL